MKKILFYLSLAICLLSDIAVFAQNQISTNPLTGGLYAVFPIYNLSSGAVSFPINLIYSTSGVKPKDIEGSAGIGWQLQAGGAVYRQMRGLPDDGKKDSNGLGRLGWLYNNNGTKISNFTVANTGSSNCNNELSDISYINTNFSDLSDTEPDIFTVEAPGLSCQLIFDNNHTPRLLNYQDLVISYTTNDTPADLLYGAITSFTITNSKGVVYVFSVPERMYQQTLLNTVSLSNGAATYLANTHNRYQNGISYYSTWYLKSMTDVNGNGIVLNYTVTSNRGSEDDIRLYAGAAGGATIEKPQYAIYMYYAPLLLTSIQTNDNGILTTAFTLAYSENTGGTNQNIVSNIVGLGHNFSFGYNFATSTDSKKTYTRGFLSSFSDPGCSTPVNYTFDYAGVTGSSTVLCDSATTHTDYWGYYSSNPYTSAIPALYVNPSNNAYQRYVGYTSSVGSDYAGIFLDANRRTVDPVNIKAGALSKITYSQGGTTTISYEPNDYLDKPSGTVVKGGGIRVSQITDYDGINTANNMIRNYAYTDPTNGLSSGKPLSLPAFGFTIPYTGIATGTDYWNYSTMRSADDLSTEDHSIYYAFSRISQVNAGSTLYEYYFPAMVWDNTAHPTCSGCTTPDWSPAIQYASRSTCASYPAIKNDIASYPFAPNTNYDFERGLLQTQTNYTDDGAKVSETTYTYTRTGAPRSFAALKWEHNQDVMAYAKYTIYYGTSELTAQVTKKTFDSGTHTNAQTATTDFIYGSPNHKMVTKMQVNGSDNSTLITNISYVKDFNLTPGSNPNITALYNLKQRNVNIPVESYTQVKRGTAAALTTTASLTLFNSFMPGSNTLYLPSQTLKSYAADGIPNFQPYMVSGQTDSHDPSYFPTANYTSYDNSGYLLTGDDAHKNVRTIITDHTSAQIVAVFKNAAANEIAFNDFDSNTPLSVNFSNNNDGDFYSEGHTGKSSSLPRSPVYSKSVIKKSLESYYILSAWINAAASGTLNISLITSGNQTFSYQEPFGNTGGSWKYFKWKVPVANMTPSFTIQFGSGTPINIDDIIFYPGTSSVNTFAYDKIAYHKIAETNTNGVSTYYQNDQWGRVLFTFDQDKNITAKRTFFTSDNLAQDFTPSISFLPSTVIAATPVTFTAYSPACVAGTTFTWNFGDGTSPVTGTNTQFHTYSNPGTYAVNVAAVNPVLGTRTASNSIVVNPIPLTVNICMSGVTFWDNCSLKSLNTVPCGTNPNDEKHSYYTVTSIGGAVGTISYQWQVSTNNGATWTNVGTNASQYVVNRGGKAQASRIRCVITTSTGQTATSGYELFDVGNC